jgi:hypothetical protein
MAHLLEADFWASVEVRNNCGIRSALTQAESNRNRHVSPSVNISRLFGTYPEAGSVDVEPARQSASWDIR